MDRRYGGDPLAPPRPPKSLPRVHRQPAPEPTIMSASPHQSTFNLEVAQPAGPPLQPRNLQQTQQPPPLPPLIRNHQVHSTSPIPATSPPTPPPPITQTHTHTHTHTHTQPSINIIAQAPITVPLTSSSFARRRPPPTDIITPAITSQTPSSIQDIASTLSPVTLAVPRPETERLGNEYVDTPFRTPKLGGRLLHGLHSAHVATSTGTTTTATTNLSGSRRFESTTATHSLVTLSKPIVPHGGSGSTTTTTTSTTASTPITKIQRPSVLSVSAITKQPLPFTKDQMTETLHEDVDLHPANGESLTSITCPQCKRCRCEECQRPRQLPSRWVCDNTCLCSAETIIDYASCLCCVKALFYHCSKDHEMDCDGDSISCADDPCSCLPHKRTQRWAWLSALSLALPCLWCYWPMRGCAAMCAKLYARHSRHGCRCPQNGVNNIGASAGRTSIRSSDMTPEKRLLDSHPEF